MGKKLCMLRITLNFVCRMSISEPIIPTSLFNDSMYPRPRYHVSASLAETFDLVTHASGGAGCLKYLVDYFAAAEYETGYVNAHMENRELSNYIDRAFSDKNQPNVYILCKKNDSETALLIANIGEDISVHNPQVCNEKHRGI